MVVYMRSVLLVLLLVCLLCLLVFSAGPAEPTKAPAGITPMAPLEPSYRFPGPPGRDRLVYSTGESKMSLSSVQFDVDKDVYNSDVYNPALSSEFATLPGATNPPTPPTRALMPTTRTARTAPTVTTTPTTSGIIYGPVVSITPFDSYSHDFQLTSLGQLAQGTVVKSEYL